MFFQNRKKIQDFTLSTVLRKDTLVTHNITLFINLQENLCIRRSVFNKFLAMALHIFFEFTVAANT